MPNQFDPNTGDGLLDLVTEALEDDKAEDLVSIDLAGKTSIADHMVIASGRSSRHVSSMADHLMHRLKSAGAKMLGVEGQQRGDWVLVDAGDVIVHLFRPEVRDFYGLEKMWGVKIGGETPLVGGLDVEDDDASSVAATG